MRAKSETLIRDLSEMTRNHLERITALRALSEQELNHRSAPDRWSALECIEHLARYEDFYLPELDKRIKAKKHSASTEFTSGWLGEYFAKSMMPKEKLNKMKTFTNMNPQGSALDKGTLDRFEHQLREMLTRLQDARKVNLNRTKTSISISNFIKLRLGDTFRVVIYHNERHMLQAERAVASARAK